MKKIFVLVLIVVLLGFASLAAKATPERPIPDLFLPHIENELLGLPLDDHIQSAVPWDSTHISIFVDLEFFNLLKASPCQVGFQGALHLKDKWYPASNGQPLEDLVWAKMALALAYGSDQVKLEMDRSITSGPYHKRIRKVEQLVAPFYSERCYNYYNNSDQTETEMETTAQLKEKDGTTGSEEHMLVGNTFLSESDYQTEDENMKAYYKRLPKWWPKEYKPTHRTSWTWKFGYTRQQYPTLYRTNEVTTEI